MKKTPPLIWPVLILLIIAGIFYLDKTMPIGTDVSFYLDFSSLLFRGEKFLIDFFDYRVPLFPLLFSAVYKMGWGDFANRWLMLFSIYSFYGLTLYFISLSLTRSPIKSFTAVLLVLVSISARQFDHGRDIGIPLFYHTAELAGLFFLFKAIFHRPSFTFKRILFFSILSGMLFGVAFIGRPVHIIIPLVVAGTAVYRLYKKKKEEMVNNTRPAIFGFLTGLGLSSIIVFLFFYVPETHFLSLAKKWLWEIPPVIYKAEPLRIIKKLITTLYWGWPEIRNIHLPLFWFTYVLSAAGLAVFLFSESAQNIGSKISSFYQKNRALFLFVLLMGFMAVTTVLMTGSGAKSHEAPFFSFYFFVLILILSNIKLKEQLKSWKIYLFIVVFFLPHSVDFAKKELKIYLIDRANQADAFLPERVAAELKKLAKAKDPVLILGAYPTVTRLADYRPFMGQTNDIFLYSGHKFFEENYQENLAKEMEKVNVAYKLFDYPNLKALSGIREDESNPVYLYIEKYLKEKFTVAAIVENSQLQKVIIYRRKFK